MGGEHERLVWIDLEMTGLDITKESIIEIATVVTDGELNILATGPNLAVTVSEELLAGMDEWNTSHHHASGLVERVRTQGVSCSNAEIQTLEFLKEWVPHGSAPLCGIYDTMQFINPDVATICTGIAASMAAVLLCAGQDGKRSGLPHSRVMIHQPLGGAQGQASDIEITAREILKLKKELYEIIAKHSNQPYDKVYDDSDRDYWMKALEAKEYGMIDEVLTRN